MMFDMTGGQFQSVYNILPFAHAPMTARALFLRMWVVSIVPKCRTLGASFAVMLIAGYPGELMVEGPLAPRWIGWGCALEPFCDIVFELLVGLAGATSSEPNNQVKSLIVRPRGETVVSRLTYPMVYIFPMSGLEGAGAVVAIQCGYCAYVARQLAVPLLPMETVLVLELHESPTSRLCWTLGVGFSAVIGYP